MPILLKKSEFLEGSIPEFKKLNLYAMLKNVLPEKWFDDERIQACYTHETEAEYRNRFNQSVDPINHTVYNYELWKCEPKVFWQLPKEMFTVEAFKTQYNTTGEQVIKKLFKIIDSFTENESLQLTGLYRERVKNIIITTICISWQHLAENQLAPNPCFTKDLALIKYIDDELKAETWEGAPEFMDHELEKTLKKEFILNLTPHDDFNSVKAKLINLFKDYYLNPTKGLFGKLGIAKRSHKNEANELIAALQYCNNPGQLKNIIHTAINIFANGYDIGTLIHNYPRNRGGSSSSDREPIPEWQEVNRNYCGIKNSYYQRLLASINLLNVFNNRNELAKTLEVEHPRSKSFV